MPNTTEETEPTKTPAQLATEAVNYFLHRVSSDENVRYHCGAFTELYSKMRAAHCAESGKTPEQVDTAVFGRPLKYKAAGQKLDRIRELLDEIEGEVVHGNDLVDKIREALC